MKQTISLLQQLWGVATLALALLISTHTLSAQDTYKGVKGSPQDVTIDGTLETHAQAKGVSANGRYIWAAYYETQAAYVYDTEQQTCVWQQCNAGNQIDLKFVTNDGDIIFQKDRKTTLYIPHTGGEVVIASPDSEFPILEVTGSSVQGERLVGNLRREDPFDRTCKPFVANRTAEGSYTITPLPIPSEDALGGKPLETTVLAISPDGKILMGRQINADGYYPRLLQWTIPEGEPQPTEYTFPGESLFFDTSKPQPGLEPQPEEYDSEDLWETAWLAWGEKVKAYCKKPMLDPKRWYYSPSTHRILFTARLLVLDQETGTINEILMPGYWDVAKQRGEILKHFEGLTTAEALADGSLICVDEEKSFYHAYRVSPASGEKTNLGVWLQEQTGILVSDFFLADMNGELALGWPSISTDGKTLVLGGPDRSNPEAFRTTYLQFTEPLGHDTALQLPTVEDIPRLSMSPSGEIFTPQLAHHQIFIYTATGVCISEGRLSATGQYQVPRSCTEQVLLIQIIAPLTGAQYTYKLFPSPTKL